jgi:steroid delta-isomerase-like uncharacterized protein
MTDNISASEMERAVRKVKDSFNRGDLSVIDEIYDKEFVYHGSGETAHLTRDGWTQFVRGMLTAFPDMHIQLDEFFTSGDRLCYRITISGTHKGELLGLPPTNRKVSIRAIGIMKFRDGKIIEQWDVADDLGMLRQVGAIQD